MSTPVANGQATPVSAVEPSGRSEAAVPLAESYAVDHRLSAKRGAEGDRLFRQRGAIIADDRKGEGYTLPSGKQQTCLVEHIGAHRHIFRRHCLLFFVVPRHLGHTIYC